MNQIFNIKPFFKFLSKNMIYTLINVIGLSLSLMFVILIVVYTKQELSVDDIQEKSERIYILGNEEVVGAAWKLKDKLLDRYPEIEEIAPVVTSFPDQNVMVGEHNIKADLLFSDSSFFNIFSFPLIKGDREQVMDAPAYAVISETFAGKSFPGKDPLGKTIRLNDSVSVIVNGIMKDMSNSIIPATDILVNIEHIKYFNSSLASEYFGNATGADLFILVKENSDLQSKTADMESYFREIFWIYKRGIIEQVILNPFEEAYFSEVPNSNNLQTGDRKFVMILISVGILILLFAVLNYINLTVAQMTQRAKEMATRRLLGSSRSELFLKLIFESTLLTIFSFLLGLLLAYSVLPFANDLLQTTIDLGGAATLNNILICILFIIVLGFISGIIPAVTISNTKAIDVVRGTFRRKNKMVFSRLFITFQNVITIMMIVASITMVLQVNHLTKAPLGYNTSHLMTISTHQFETNEQISTFRDEVSRLGCVSRVGYAAGTPFDRGNNYTFVHDDRNISMQIFKFDSVAFALFDFEVLRKNEVSYSEEIYLNQQAIQELGIDEETVHLKLFDEELQIAGIVKNFQLGNILMESSPVLIQCLKSTQDFWPWSIVIETQGDPVQAYHDISKVYHKMLALELPGEFIDKEIRDSFETQRQTSVIVTIFCVIAIIISLLGLLAMSNYYVQQRSQEIAIRRVFGSSEKEILSRLINTFLSYVLIAFVIAIPLIWYLMHRWISDFSYRIKLYPWIFIAAGLFLLLIAFLTVFRQSYKAATANPSEGVRS